MASLQVEIPSSSSSSSQRFGFILRDRNHRYDQNAVVFQKNLKVSVKDEKSENLVDSWIETQNVKNKRNNKNRSTEKPIVESSNLQQRNEKIGACSLVQIWEARLNRSNGGNSPSHDQSAATSVRSDSGVSVQDSHLSDESEIVEAKNGDPTVEIESDSGGRVADLIRRLSNEEKLTAGEYGGGGDGGLSIIRTPRPCVSSCSSSEKSNFPMVSFSPRLRGRQAFSDLLMQLERDRHRELESLLERNAVSRFTQRGRLQVKIYFHYLINHPMIFKKLQYRPVSM